MKDVIKIAVIGAGYGLLEIIPLIKAINAHNYHKEYKIIGVLDDNPSLASASIYGYPVLGTLGSWQNLANDICFVFCIGSFDTRLKRKYILENLEIPNERFCSLIHPSADLMISKLAIGHGVTIHNGVLVHPMAVIGNFVTISANCVIGVKNFIGSFSLFAASVSTGTDIIYGTGTFVGTGAIIAPSVKLGAGAQVGVGSVVFRDVEPGHKVVGNPAKPYSRDTIPSGLSEQSNSEIGNMESLNEQL